MVNRETGSTRSKKESPHKVSVQNSGGVGVVDRSEDFFRRLGECNIDDCRHGMTSVSVDFNDYVATASKALIAYEIMGLLASYGVATIFTTGRIKAILSAVGGVAAGDTISVCQKDQDLNYGLDSSKQLVGGYANKWNPGKHAVIPIHTYWGEHGVTEEPREGYCRTHNGEIA